MHKRLNNVKVRLNHAVPGHNIFLIVIANTKPMHIYRYAFKNIHSLKKFEERKEMHLACIAWQQKNY